MDDDEESVDLIPKIPELHIIQIFGFDGKVGQQRLMKLTFNFIFKLQEKFHLKFIQTKSI